MQGTVAAGTSWTVPTAPMTNAVTIDGKSYKVVTANSANNWIIAGPDYLGISNSNQLDNGGGAAGGKSFQDEVTSTLMGIWASEANEVPNAYNWNYFYDLYAASVNLDASAYAPFSTQSVGANYDSSTGTIGSYKYRPEIMWGTANNDKAVSYIREGKYFASSDDEAAGTEADSSLYACPNDADYNPVYVGMDNNATNVFAASTYLYQAAEAAQTAIDATKNYNSNGAYNVNNVTWRTVNALPRTTRYEADAAEVKMSATDCAVAYEKTMKGAAYYTLSKIADGTTTKKKVAFVFGKDGIDFTGNTITVAAFDCVDPWGPNDNAGFAGALPLAVDQLTTDNVISTSGQGTSMASGMTWRTYTATADELATCDYIIATGVGGTNNAGVDAGQLKQWVIDKATTSAAKTAAAKIQYGVTPPTVANAHNFTIEKSIFSAYNFDFVYSDLFPNMELETYWYDNIYHIKSAYLKQTMQWALGNVSLPDGVELSDMGSSYSAKDCDNKFYLGYQYFTQNKTSDPVLAAVLSGTGRITGETGLDFSVATPTAYYEQWAKSYKFVKSSQTVKLTKNASKTIKTSTVAKKKATVAVTVSGAKTKLSATLSSAAKKAGLKVTVNSKSKVTVTVPKGCKAGTYKISVKAAASDEYKASAAKTITIKVK